MPKKDNLFIPLDDKEYTKSDKLDNSVVFKIFPDISEIKNLINYIEDSKLLQDTKVKNNSHNKQDEIVNFIRYALWRYDLCPDDI